MVVVGGQKMIEHGDRTGNYKESNRVQYHLTTPAHTDRDLQL